MAMLPPFPAKDPVLTKEGLFTLTLLQWFNALIVFVQRAALSVGRTTVTAQGASIVSTSIPTPTLTTATYRLSAYGRVTRAASVSSSLAITFGWTDGGVACFSTSAAVTGNTTATTTTPTITVNADAGTSLTYATTYASVGATSMQYALTVTAEQLA